MASCTFCEQRALSDHDDAFLIHRYPLSDLRVGQHQYFKGYCVLVLRDHVVEPTDLDPKDQVQFFQELSTASSLLQKTFSPYKMNYACYGNVVPHMHWHLIPRYEHEAARLQPPFCLSEEFKNFPVTPEDARRIAREIRQHISA